MCCIEMLEVLSGSDETNLRDLKRICSALHCGVEMKKEKCKININVLAPSYFVSLA